MLTIDRIQKLVSFFQKRQSNFLKSELIYKIPTSGDHLQDYLTRNKPLQFFSQNTHSWALREEFKYNGTYMGINIFKKPPE